MFIVSPSSLPRAESPRAAVGRRKRRSPCAACPRRGRRHRDDLRGELLRLLRAAVPDPDPAEVPHQPKPAPRSRRRQTPQHPARPSPWWPRPKRRCVSRWLTARPSPRAARRSRAETPDPPDHAKAPSVPALRGPEKPQDGRCRVSRRSRPPGRLAARPDRRSGPARGQAVERPRGNTAGQQARCRSYAGSTRVAALRGPEREQNVGFPLVADGACPRAP